MYVQHPYKYEGKYYAKIDGVFYEISKEVAMAMFAEYRNEIYRSRKWAPESEEDDQMEDFQDLENKQEKEEPADQKDKKWKRKTKRCEILDCAFSANSDGLSIADMADMDKRCYSVAELQEILGVSRQCIYELLKKKKFSWVMVGGKYRISKKSFDEWLDQHQ